MEQIQKEPQLEKQQQRRIFFHCEEDPVGGYIYMSSNESLMEYWLVLKALIEKGSRVNNYFLKLRIIDLLLLLLHLKQLDRSTRTIVCLFRKQYIITRNTYDIFYTKVFFAPLRAKSFVQ
jgi:hypothetical protein